MGKYALCFSIFNFSAKTIISVIIELDKSSDIFKVASISYVSEFGKYIDTYVIIKGNENNKIEEFGS